MVLAWDDEGNPIYKRAFDTQARKQLNSWLGGFESILKCMTPANFDWFIHVMLFHHTKQVLKRMDQKATKGKQDETEEDNVDNEDNDGNDDSIEEI